MLSRGCGSAAGPRAAFIGGAAPAGAGDPDTAAATRGGGGAETRTSGAISGAGRPGAGAGRIVIGGAAGGDASACTMNVSAAAVAPAAIVTAHRSPARATSRRTHPTSTPVELGSASRGAGGVGFAATGPESRPPSAVSVAESRRSTELARSACSRARDGANGSSACARSAAVW